MASETINRTPNTIAVFLGIAAAFVVVAVVLSGALVVGTPGNDVEQKRAAQRLETRTKLESEALEKLNSLGWADKAKGTAHVPINQAMTMMVAELTAKKPAPSSVKVEPPLPMPVIDPKSTEPPPPALPSSPQGADTIRFAPNTEAAPAAVPAAPAPPAAEKPPQPLKVPSAPPPAPAPPTDKPAQAAPAPAIPLAPEPPAIPPSTPPENPAPSK